jgi:DNA-binding transcriptional ArsR family regulator
MPYRLLAANELAHLLRAIAHPQRVQIVEELRSAEKDVGTLQRALGISHSNVSQHLAVLRALRVVSERRHGRQVFYRLRTPLLAEWILEGIAFLPEVDREVDQVRSAVRRAKADWSQEEDE